MDDLRERFSVLDDVPVPDPLARRPSRPLTGPPPSALRRGVTALVAVVLAVASFAILVRAFGAGSPPKEPVGAGSFSVELGAPIDVGDGPNAVAAGAGAVWVSAHPAEGGDLRLVRLDPMTGAIVARIPVPALPTWEVGGGGLVALSKAVWVTGTVEQADGSGCCDAIVYRVDPATNEVAEHIDLGPGSGADVWIDGTDMWVLVSGVEADPERIIEVVRIDMVSRDEVARISLPTNWAKQVFAFDGSIWVQGDRASTEDVDPDVLFQIDPATNRYVGAVDLPTPAYVAVDGSSIWQRSSGGVVRIDPDGARTQVPLDGLYEWCCSDIASDGAGGLWAIAKSVDPGSVRVVHVTSGGEIDGEAETSVKDRPLEMVTSAFDPEHGTIWLAQYRDTVTPIRIVPD
jgi:hypothetical protein